MKTTDFIRSQAPEPHLARTRAILTAHPELKELFKPYPMTFVWTALIVGLQFALAAVFSFYEAPWWLVFIVAYVVGAVANHSLFIVIHEATHNLVLKGPLANRWAGMLANLPGIFPAAMGFRKFHLLHHQYQGEFAMDADLAGPIEAKIVGNSTWRKVLWMLFFFVIEGIVRPARLKNVKILDKWTLVNLVVQLVVNAAVIVFLGWSSFLYLFLSFMFSIGLHPLGARWIQEHYVVHGNQETYSYYGPFNKLMFNVGYHNEHHDLMSVPWPYLPKVRAVAREFYDPLYSHQSYTKLLLKFLFDPNMSLYSRVVRPDRVTEKRSAPARVQPSPVSLADLPAN